MILRMVVVLCPANDTRPCAGRARTGEATIDLIAGLKDVTLAAAKALKARLEAAGEAVKLMVDEDAGFLANLGVLLSAWWNSEEHYEEKQREDALEAKAKAARRQAEEERRFNDAVPSAENDYYAQSTERD